MIEAIAVYTFREIPRHVHIETWELHLFSSGVGTFQDGGQCTTFGPGCLYLSPPGSQHEAVSSDGGTFSYYHILFNPGKADAQLLEMIWLRADRSNSAGVESPGIPPLGLKVPVDRTGPELMDILRRFATGTKISRMAAEHIWSAFLCDLAEGEYDPFMQARRGFMERVFKIMQQRLTSDLDVTVIATSLDMHPSRFIRLFKTATGLPPHRYFVNLKLQGVAYLLAVGDLPLRQIAQEFGFYDEFHLSKLFKKYRGICPKQYRIDKRGR